MQVQTQKSPPNRSRCASTRHSWKMRRRRRKTGGTRTIAPLIALGVSEDTLQAAVIDAAPAALVALERDGGAR